MSEEKVERNAMVAKLYNQGKNNNEILEGLLKQGFEDYQKVKSVTMQISRLRAAGKIPNKRPASKEKRKIIKQQNSKIIKLQKDKVHKVTKLQSDQKGSGKEFLPVSYRLSEDIKWAIKTLAVKSRKEVSQLVREILQKYISEQSDKKTK